MEPTDGITTASAGVVPSGARAPESVTGPATARAYAESVARTQWGGPGRAVREEDVIDLLLVVSELVTNAVRHGGGLAAFEARPVEEGLWIAVGDHSEAVPGAVRDFPTTHRGSGYGWPLVARLARDIAVEPEPGGGKTIRVLVPLRETEAEAEAGAEAGADAAR